MALFGNNKKSITKENIEEFIFSSQYGPKDVDRFMRKVVDYDINNGTDKTSLVLLCFRDLVNTEKKLIQENLLSRLRDIGLLWLLALAVGFSTGSTTFSIVVATFTTIALSILMFNRHMHLKSILDSVRGYTLKVEKEHQRGVDAYISRKFGGFKPYFLWYDENRYNSFVFDIIKRYDHQEIALRCRNLAKKMPYSFKAFHVEPEEPVSKKKGKSVAIKDPYLLKLRDMSLDEIEKNAQQLLPSVSR